MLKYKQYLWKLLKKHMKKIRKRMVFQIKMVKIMCFKQEEIKMDKIAKILSMMRITRIMSTWTTNRMKNNNSISNKQMEITWQELKQ